MSKKPKGICNRCGHFRTLLSLVRGYCKPCGYEWGNCIRCCAYRRLFVSGRCYNCYQDDLVKKYLDEIAANFKPASEYNNDLFNLSMNYTRRYRMTYSSLKPIRLFSKILTQYPIDPIRSWQQIYQIRKQYPLMTKPRGKSRKANGCLWHQVGYMLQELGVLGPRSDEFEHRIPRLIEDMDPETSERVIQFLKNLKSTGRTEATLNRFLSVLQIFNQWLSQLDPPETLWVANLKTIECYLDLMIRTLSYTHVTTTFRRLSGFYRWAKIKKFVLLDPTLGIQLSRPAQKILICSKTQYDQLIAFVKSEESNSVQALIILLCLFYGLTLAPVRYSGYGIVTGVFPGYV